jgi:hypothetical protein
VGLRPRSPVAQRPPHIRARIGVLNASRSSALPCSRGSGRRRADCWTYQGRWGLRARVEPWLFEPWFLKPRLVGAPRRVGAGCLFCTSAGLCPAASVLFRASANYPDHPAAGHLWSASLLFRAAADYPAYPTADLLRALSFIVYDRALADCGQASLILAPVGSRERLKHWRSSASVRPRLARDQAIPLPRSKRRVRGPIQRNRHMGAWPGWLTPLEGGS